MNSFDLAIDNSSGPIVAMVHPSLGLCVAHRPFAEVAENERTVGSEIPTFTIIPNPAGATAELSRSSPLETQMAFQVFDLTGRAVARGILKRGQQRTRLDLSGLTRGLYFVVPEGHPEARVKLILAAE